MKYSCGGSEKLGTVDEPAPRPTRTVERRVLKSHRRRKLIFLLEWKMLVGVLVGEIPFSFQKACTFELNDPTKEN